jgi:hypothetical protein
MRKLLLIFLFTLPTIAFAQTATVTGHVVLPSGTSPANGKVCVTLQNYKPNSPRVVGTGTVVQQTNYCFTPAVDGSFSTTQYRNDSITPSGTFWRFDFMFGGIQQSSASYLVNASPFNLDNATPLTTTPVAGPNQIAVQAVPCVQSTPATVWTCTHNFNDPSVFVQVKDTNSQTVFPDSVNTSNPNVATINFVSAQAGTALLLHAGALTIGTGQPNNVVQNPIAGQVIQGQLNISANTILSGTVTCRNFANVRCVDPLNSAGWAGSDVGAWVNAALADTPNGGTVQIAPGSYTLSTQMVLTSNSTIECAPNTTTITASASFNSPVILASGISNFQIAGCVIDGNSSANSNQFNAIQTTNSSGFKIQDNHFQNFNSRVLNISSGSTSFRIEGNEIDHYGQALPAAINNNEAIALAPSGPGAGVQDGIVTKNFIHDGNGGIALYNSNAAPSATANTARNQIVDNRIEALANDGILLFNTNGTSNGSLIQGNTIARNIIRCTGWPAAGTGWDSSNCPPGVKQTGASASPSGAGIDANSSNQDQNIFEGNHSDFNFFEGGDDTPQTHTTVNTSGTTVTYVNGDPFLTGWKANQGIIISGVNYLISSVAGPTSTLTLTTSAGTQTNAALVGVTNSRSIWKGNYFYGNGNGAPLGGQGSGLAIMGGQVTSSGNYAVNNAFSGFFDQIAAYVTHSGDYAVQNCRTQNCNEFNVDAALAPTYTGISTNARSGSNGIFFDPNTSSAFAESASICGASGCGFSIVQNQGTLNRFSDGRVRGASNTNGGTHSLCFSSGGGTGCLNYGGGPGGFDLQLPSVNGTLSPLIAKDCGTTTTCSATDISSTVRIIKGSVALASGTPSTATVTGFSPVFSSTTSFVCTGTNATTQANPVKITNASASSITITGPNTVTDTINYICVGN